MSRTSRTRDQRDDEAKRRRAFLADLRSLLKRTRGPNKIPASLRDQLVGLVQHVFRHQLDVVYPGVTKMACWAGASTKIARANVRTLERWLVAVPVGCETGGRGNAVRYLIDFAALFDALVLLGCKPSPFVHDFCREKAELQRNLMKKNHPLGAAERRKIQDKMQLNRSLPPSDDQCAVGIPQKAEQKAEESSAGYVENIEVGSLPTDVPPARPSKGRSADASLCVFLSSKLKGQLDYAGERCAPVMKSAVTDDGGLDHHFSAFCRAYPVIGKPERALAQFERAVENGHKPEKIIAAAWAAREAFTSSGVDRRYVPRATSWLESESWDQETTDQS